MPRHPSRRGQEAAPQMKTKNPATGGRAFKIKARWICACQSDQLQTSTRRIAPVVAVPEALANHAARRVGRFFHVHRTAVGRAAGGDRATDDARRRSGRPPRLRQRHAVRLRASLRANRRSLRPRRRQQMSSSCPGLSWGGAFGAPGLGLTHTLFRTAVSLKSAQRSIESKRSASLWSEKTVFQAASDIHPGKAAPSGMLAQFNEDERDRRSVANPGRCGPASHNRPRTAAAARCRVAVAGIDHIGRAAVIAVAGTIIARTVIAVLRSDRAADDGAADQSGGDASGNPAAARCAGAWG